MYDFLQEEKVQEIFVNPNGSLFVDRAGQPRTHEGYVKPANILNLLSTVASSLNETINRDKPHIDGVLVLDGSRISGEIPPMVSAPSLRIRKHAQYVEPLSYFVDTGVMTGAQYALIRECIKTRKNIIIVGSTGSGKTFLANSCLKDLAELTPEDRVLTIEDTAELNVSSKDALSWVTTPTVTMQTMLYRALRATPKRIVVGEVRGGEAYQLMKMWNTGHDGGLATIHSNKGAMDGLTRLERMCGESPEVNGMGRSWIRELVAEVVHVLINLTVHKEGRTISSIIKVQGLDETQEQYAVKIIQR